MRSFFLWLVALSPVTRRQRTVRGAILWPVLERFARIRTFVGCRSEIPPSRASQHLQRETFSSVQRKLTNRSTDKASFSDSVHAFLS